MQNLSTLKSAFVAALIGTLFFMYARSGCAQPVSFSDASVEWTAAHSEVIVRAIIEEVSPHKYRNGLHRDTGINRFHTISIRVLETVKGSAADRLQFVHNGAIRHFRFLEAKESQQEVLLFLDHWSRNPHFRRAYGEYAYTRFPLIVTHVAILKPDDSYWAHADVPILSRDLTRLSNARQLVGTIKEFLDSREYDGPLGEMTIELPAELRGGFHRVDFTLPSDRTAEVPVLGFEAFKAEYARPKSDDQELRVYGRTGGGYVGVDSLELMAIDCDVIVRAVIEDSCFLGTDSNPAQGVKLRVLETLKGECATQIGVYTPYSPDVEQLQGDQQDLVFFLTSQRLSIPAAALGYRTRGEVWDDAVIALDERKAEVLFTDMSRHRQPMEILRRVRNVVDREQWNFPAADDGSAPYKHHGTRPPVFSFHPPSSLVKGSVIERNVYSRVYLSVDRELETNARKWAVSENQDHRWLAARAMIYFKSAENAAILMTLLDDDATWARRDMLHMMENLPYPHDPKHLVRWEAWHVLAGWGYDVPIPSFGEGGRTRR